MRIARHVRALETITFHAGRYWPLEAALWDIIGRSRASRSRRCSAGPSTPAGVCVDRGATDAPQTRRVRARDPRGRLQGDEDPDRPPCDRGGTGDRPGDPRGGRGHARPLGRPQPAWRMPGDTSPSLDVVGARRVADRSLSWACCGSRSRSRGRTSRGSRRCVDQPGPDRRRRDDEVAPELLAAIEPTPTTCTSPTWCSRSGCSGRGPWRSWRWRGTAGSRPTPGPKASGCSPTSTWPPASAADRTSSSRTTRPAGRRNAAISCSATDRHRRGGPAPRPDSPGPRNPPRRRPSRAPRGSTAPLTALTALEPRSPRPPRRHAHPADATIDSASVPRRDRHRPRHEPRDGSTIAEVALAGADAERPWRQRGARSTTAAGPPPAPPSARPCCSGSRTSCARTPRSSRCSNRVDVGHPIRDALNVDVPGAATCLQWYAEAADKQYGETGPTGPDALSLVTREPIGVVAALVPWNYPLIISAWKLGPALATGNSVVLKPASHSPLTALRLAELAAEAGLPDGVLNVVPGPGATVGEALARDPRVDKIAFTGSIDTGRRLLLHAADSNLKPVQLELGGKSPQLILADAPDLDAAASAVGWGIFYNAGQTCNAGSRVLVQRGIRDAFLEKLVALRGADEARRPARPTDCLRRPRGPRPPRPGARVRRHRPPRRGGGAHRRRARRAGSRAARTSRPRSSPACATTCGSPARRSSGRSSP